MTAHTQLYRQQLMLFGRSALARSDTANSSDAFALRSSIFRLLWCEREVNSIGAAIDPRHGWTPSFNGRTALARSDTASIGSPHWTVPIDDIRCIDEDYLWSSVPI